MKGGTIGEMEVISTSSQAPVLKYCCPICENSLDREVNDDDIVVWICEACTYFWTDEVADLNFDFSEWKDEL